jgi:hypothetical protein
LTETKRNETKRNGIIQNEIKPILTDTENICLPSQNMKFGGESFSFRHSAQYSWNITDVPQWCLAVNNRRINHFVIA